jgi:Rrf2 family protein
MLPLNSRVSRYALRALLCIASGEVRAGRIARAGGAPPAFLRKYAPRLARQGILRERRGAGAYRLARPPARITLLEVVEAVGGPVRGDAARDTGIGDPAVVARLQAVCEDVAKRTRALLARTTLADLMPGDE